MTERAPFELIHANGCGKPALLMISAPVPWEVRKAEMFRHVDGTPVKPTDPVQCDECKAQLWPEDFKTAFVRARPEEQTDRTVTGGLRESGPPEYSGVSG